MNSTQRVRVGDAIDFPTKALLKSDGPIVLLSPVTRGSSLGAVVRKSWLQPKAVDVPSRTKLAVSAVDIVRPLIVITPSKHPASFPVRFA